MNGPASLFELARAEQEARNSAALAAISVRRDDIRELQRLTEALGAGGFNVRPSVSTSPCGSNATCQLQLFMTCRRGELTTALEWLTSADIAVSRVPALEVAGAIVYQIMLRDQQLLLNIMLADPPPATTRFTTRRARSSVTAL